jgi:hypothetical protein
MRLHRVAWATCDFKRSLRPDATNPVIIVVPDRLPLTGSLRSSKRCRILNALKASNLHTCFLTLRFKKSFFLAKYINRFCVFLYKITHLNLYRHSALSLLMVHYLP